MNSTIKGCNVKKPKFPCLREDNDGMIILFTDETSGTVVHPSENGTYKIGHRSVCWTIRLYEHTDKTVNLFN